MKNEQLQRVLRLLRRTGDRGIVLDAETSEVFVLMDVDEYEGLLDDADWSELSPFDSGAKTETAKPETVPTETDDEEADLALDDLIELEERNESEPISAATPAASARPVKQELEKVSFEDVFPSKRPSVVLSEESLADVPSDEEPEEEKFYLEPVE